MNIPMAIQSLHLHCRGRPWILIATYDVSAGTSGEGYVAFNICRYSRLVGVVVHLERVLTILPYNLIIFFNKLISL